ncbi:MAG: hypothetical protein ACLQU2_26715 [Candidatus Binataceae bacterium]
MVNLEKPSELGWFMFCLGVAWLAVSASGCVPVLVGVAAFPLTAVALDLTHSVDGTASYMVWERQALSEATTVCNANGAPPNSDCMSYEMQAKR